MNQFRTFRLIVSGRTLVAWADVLRDLFAVRRFPTDRDPGGRSWARRVKAESEIPSSFRDALAALHLDGTQPFPHMVLMPTFEGILRNPENEKLVCLIGDRVHVLENAGAGISRVSYSPDDILCLEHGTVLLYSWITIRGRTTNASPSCTILKFNTVTEDVMAPITELLRPRSQAKLPGARAAEPSGLRTLGQVNLKFRAYAEGSLLPGDSVVLWIYQPQIRRRRAGLMGPKLARSIAPAQLVMLTRRELVLIRDDETQQPATGEPYGAIRTYIPLGRITSASTGTAHGGLIALQLHLSPGLDVEVNFEPSRKEAVSELLGTLAAAQPSSPMIAALP